MHACSMKARQNNGMLSQLISSCACGRSELTQKLFPLPPNTFFYGGKQQIRRTGISKEEEQILQNFPEPAARGGWEAEGFARCSLSTEQ